MQLDTAAPRVTVRLDATDHAILADIQAALRTPLLPSVNVSDALRAGMRELHARIVRERGDAV